MNCLVVDDDEMSRSTIEHYINQTDGLELVGVCNDGVEGLNFLKKNKVDLLFLDIEMPQMSGLDLLDTIEDAPSVILITSKKDYAVDAFEYAVSDYLLKPIKYTRFLKAVNKVSKTASNVEVSSDDIFIKTDLKFVKVNFKEVFMVEALADYVIIHLESSKHIVHSTMKAIEQKLPDNMFIRVHRSYIINMSKINSVDGAVVTLGAKKVPIGASYKKDFMNKLRVL